MTVALDQELFAELMRLPPLPFLRLLKLRRAQLFDAAAYHVALDAFRTTIERLAPNDVIKKLYHAKTNELSLRADCIAAIARGDDTTVASTSLALYGTPRFTRSELEAHLDDMCQRAGKHKTRVLFWVDAVMFAAMARRLLDTYGLTTWRIKLVRRGTLHVGHSKRTQQPVLRIPTALRVTRKRASQLLAHEVEAHILRHANGAQSSLRLLERGTAGYLRTDEGLAMLLQQHYSANDYHWPGFWEAYAASLALEFNGEETYRRLAAARTRLAVKMGREHPDNVGASAAKRLCKRLYRGIASHSTPGLGFFRDHVYLSGYDEIRTWSTTHDVRELYVGHVALHDLDAIARLGITPSTPPKFIAKEIVHTIVREHRATQNDVA